MKPIHTYASEWRCARRLFPKTSLRRFRRNNKRRRSDTRLVPHQGTARKRFVMVQAQFGLGCRILSGLAPEGFMFERLTKGLNRHPARDAPTTTVVTQKLH